MPRNKTTLPAPSREKGQRSRELPDIYFERILPLYRQPEWFNADMWRAVVASQPFAVVCRDTIVQNVLALDWKIEPRDSTQRNELKTEIDYYTKFLENNGDYDYTHIIEWGGEDLLTLPFGFGAEVGREGDNPEGKVLWIELLDGGTLFPTLNKKWPVGQLLKEAPTDPVYFPAHAINRIYMSPRTWIRRKGWGVAPPEKIYLALELLRRGDYYYANLLLDTPEAGVLDLGDMEKGSAEEWVKSWKALLGGIDPFKVPVLYEHTTQAKFIPFSRSPVEMMFDKATMKYAAILAAGYGLSLSDIGIQAVASGGETLAGSIRQERRTRKTGVGIAKKKFKYFFDRLLPESLEFKFIDLDDEVSVAVGRARLASATAAGMMIDKRMFSPKELRLQTVADGLISISVPEDLPEDTEFPEPAMQGSPERPSMLGRPVAPSAGGTGEVRSDIFTKNLNSVLDISELNIKRAIHSILPQITTEIKTITEEFGEDIMWDEWYQWKSNLLWGVVPDDEISEQAVITLGDIKKKLKDSMFSWIGEQRNKFNQQEVVDELSTMFSEIKIQKMKEQAEYDYEHCVISKMPEKYEISEAIDMKYKSRLKKTIAEFVEKIPGYIENSIISGVSRYLSMQKILNELDIDAIMVDNMPVSLILEELEEMKSRLIYELGNKISMEINQLMED